MDALILHMTFFERQKISPVQYLADFGLVAERPIFSDWKLDLTLILTTKFNPNPHCLGFKKPFLFKTSVPLFRLLK
jgi:hypothetical protein